MPAIPHALLEFNYHQNCTFSVFFISSIRKDEQRGLINPKVGFFG
jgi:hypothetical protein